MIMRFTKRSKIFESTRNLNRDNQVRNPKNYDNYNK